MAATTSAIETSTITSPVPDVVGSGSCGYLLLAMKSRPADGFESDADSIVAPRRQEQFAAPHFHQLSTAPAVFARCPLQMRTALSTAQAKRGPLGTWW